MSHFVKRKYVKRTRTYHERIDLPDDIEDVRVREPRLSTRKLPINKERSPQRGRTTWALGTTWSPPDNTDLGLDPDDKLYLQAFEEDIFAAEEPMAQAKGKYHHEKSCVARRPRLFWKENYCEIYLNEMLHWEGRGDAQTATQCPDCVLRRVKVPNMPEIRCKDCLVPDLVCARCCVKRHLVNPLHFVEKWNGKSFCPISLKELGLRVQLNHLSMHCSNPVPSHDLKVLSINGMQDISIDYCGCERAVPQYVQLLRRGFYPATQTAIKTCATFQLLNIFHLLNLTSKASTFDFYRTLEMKTDNTRLLEMGNRYPALSRMLIQWRHLKMLKRGGRAHDPTGAAGTKDGELAILCPSCPHLGINAPEKLENIPDGHRWMHSPIVCIDANFRLKNELVSSYSSDPGLGIGMAYMVPRTPYENYVLQKASDSDISTCVGFAALAKANTKFSKGLRYTGVGAVSCGRGEIILPNAIGNLQKGERYSNMDYIFGSAIGTFSSNSCIFVSYDIACQWFKKLNLRIEDDWPEEIRPPSSTTFKPLIPKFHEHGHEQAGHEELSFNLTKGVGLTDGEAPERIWSAQGPVGHATKSQGPGTRQDIIDDHVGAWNWQKYVNMGEALIRKYRSAVRERNLQAESHRGLTSTLSPCLVEAWESLCKTWDEDVYPKKAENPYEITEAYITEAQVRKELAQDEFQRLANTGVVFHETSAAAFITQGLEVEEMQRRIKKLAKGHVTDQQESLLAGQRRILLAKIRNWESLRSVYMSGFHRFQQEYIRNILDLPATNPEDTQLWLPSALPPSHVKHVCQSGLVEIEERLRTAQCYDALAGLRHILRVKSRMVLFKNKNIRGQRGGTRSRVMIDRVHDQARSFVEKYRVARKAKLKLIGPGSWQELLRELADVDVRCYTDPERIHKGPGRKGTQEDDAADLASDSDIIATSSREEGINLVPEARDKRAGSGETRRTLSWIWTMPSVMKDSDDEEDGPNKEDQSMKVEWAKSRARTARASEEVLLLKEEMRRVLKFLEWKSQWWFEKANSLHGQDKALAEGLEAYVHDQGALQLKLAAKFRKMWSSLLLDDSKEQPKAHKDDNGNDGEWEDESDVLDVSAEMDGGYCEPGSDFDE